MTGSPVPAIDLRLGPVSLAPLPEDRLALLDEVLAAEDYAAVVVQQSTYTDGQAAVRDVQCLRERAGATLVVDNGAGAVFAL